MVVGILNISYLSIIIHFYSGASHSFISEIFYEELHIKHVTFTPELNVRLHVGNYLKENITCLVNFMKVGRKFQAELIVLPLIEFNVIMEKNWLVKYFATIEF